MVYCKGIECLHDEHPPVLESIHSYDWMEAFKYGEPHRCEVGHEHGPRATIVSDVPETPFKIWEVASVAYKAEGRNDGDHWLIVGALSDGRFFALRAWCDYTGWG